MNEPLFEIENWRGGWYYKLGSRYTGPFRRRDNAVAAAQSEVEPLTEPTNASLRVSLASRRPVDTEHEGVRHEGYRRQMLLGMAFRIPGVGDYA
tara:strand:+ start:82 stop:363 length:282 start_codon:yes stop_codon:yes gene_type:complete